VSSAAYLRRRLIAGVLAAGLCVGGIAAARSIVAAVVPSVPTSSPSVVETASGLETAAPLGATMVVQAGDTLWSIARALQPTGDVRPLVQRLSELNGGAALQVGQAVRLP